jgi:hypothetical protein
MYKFRQYVEHRDQQLDEINLKQAVAGLGLGLGGMFGANAADISNPSAIPQNASAMNRIARAEAGKEMPSYGVYSDRGKDVHRYMKDGKITQTGYYPKETQRNLAKLQAQDPSWYYDTHDNMLKNNRGQLADPHSGKITDDFTTMAGVKLKPTFIPSPEAKDQNAPIRPVAKPEARKGLSPKDAKNIIDRELSKRGAPAETGEPPLAK